MQQEISSLTCSNPKSCNMFLNEMNLVECLKEKTLNLEWSSNPFISKGLLSDFRNVRCSINCHNPFYIHLVAL